MGGLQSFFEQMAMIMIGGCCAAAWMSSFIFIKLIGIGECPVISGIIGAALGIGPLFVLETDALWLSMVIAAVMTLIAGIVIDRAVYGSGSSSSAGTGGSPASVSGGTSEFWVCSCGGKNSVNNKFCQFCGKAANQGAVGGLGNAASGVATNESWVCSCGKRNPISEANCASCGKLNEANMWVCKCGNKNLSNARFCKKCGAKRAPVRIVTEKSKATTWVCPKCKKINSNSSRVCKDCGYEK